MGNTSLKLCSKDQKTEAQKCISSMVTQDFNPKKQRPGDTEVRSPCQLPTYGLSAPNSPGNPCSEVTAGIHVLFSCTVSAMLAFASRGRWRDIAGEQGLLAVLAAAQWVWVRIQGSRNAESEDVRPLLPPATRLLAQGI